MGTGSQGPARCKDAFAASRVNAAADDPCSRCKVDSGTASCCRSRVVATTSKRGSPSVSLASSGHRQHSLCHMQTLLFHQDVCVCCTKITGCQGNSFGFCYSCLRPFSKLTHFRINTSNVQLQQDGNTAFSRGDFARAIEQYSKCLELDPSMITAHGNRAIAFLKAGRPQEALGDCDAVIAHDPSNIKAWLRKGQACFDLHQHADAKEAWEQALQVQPGNKQALLGLQLCEAPHT